MAQALVRLGRYEEALELGQQIGDARLRDLIHAMALTGLGQHDEAQRLIGRLETGTNLQALVLLAELYAWRGDAEAAFEVMMRCNAALAWPVPSRSPGIGLRFFNLSSHR
jgi:hypothetical protein